LTVQRSRPLLPPILRSASVPFSACKSTFVWSDILVRQARQETVGRGTFGPHVCHTSYALCAHLVRTWYAACGILAYFALDRVVRLVAVCVYSPCVMGALSRQPRPATRRGCGVCCLDHRPHGHGFRTGCPRSQDAF
jgi:hypothetical protein